MDVLSDRARNRALLARQMLLERADMSIADALEHHVGLQAQAPDPPYVALWARLRSFDPDELGRMLVDRAAVRMALQRSTIFLVTARDAVALRPVLQGVGERLLRNPPPDRSVDGIDWAELAAAGRQALAGGPLTFADLGDRLNERWPHHHRAALSGGVRVLVPLVQVPPRGVWGAGGPAAHAPLDDWVASAAAAAPEPVDAAGLILRYLAAFGPASVKDVQNWSGLTRLGEAADGLGDRVRRFRTEAGPEVLDLPDAPRPDADTPAPPCFVAPFDNVLLSHADRTHVITPEHRKRFSPINGVIPGAFLVDGTMAGTWRLDRPARGKAAPGGRVTLVIEPYVPLAPDVAAALEDEGRRLAAFAGRTNDEDAVAVSVLRG